MHMYVWKKKRKRRERNKLILVPFFKDGIFFNIEFFNIEIYINI